MRSDSARVILMSLMPGAALNSRRANVSRSSGFGASPAAIPISRNGCSTSATASFGPCVRIAVPVRPGAHDAKAREIAEFVRQHAELLAVGHLPHREGLERVAQDGVRDSGVRGLDHLHRDERGDAGQACEQHRLVALSAVADARARDQDPAAVLERDRLAQRDRHAARLERLVGEAFLDLRVGFGGQLGDHHGGAGGRILEADEFRARRESRRRDKADARIERKHRVGRERRRGQEHDGGERAEDAASVWQRIASCGSLTASAPQPPTVSGGHTIHRRNMGENAAGRANSEWRNGTCVQYCDPPFATRHSP